MSDAKDTELESLPDEGASDTDEDAPIEQVVFGGVLVPRADTKDDGKTLPKSV